MDLYFEILGKWAEHKPLNDFWAFSLKKNSVRHVILLSFLICNPLFHCVVFSPISFAEKWIPSVIISHRYKAQDTPARRTFEQALTGAFMSAVIKDLRPSALPFVASLIRHYTMVAVAQQCGRGMMLFVLSTSNISFLFCHLFPSAQENQSLSNFVLSLFFIKIWTFLFSILYLIT